MSQAANNHIALKGIEPISLQGSDSMAKSQDEVGRYDETCSQGSGRHLLAEARLNLVWSVPNCRDSNWTIGSCILIYRTIFSCIWVVRCIRPIQLIQVARMIIVSAALEACIRKGFWQRNSLCSTYWAGGFKWQNGFETDQQRGYSPKIYNSLTD